MRDLQFYDTLAKYQQSIYNRFDPMFLDNPFYRNLIDYTIQYKAPIFYKISHPSEHFAFSGAYHFETEREKYPNIFRRNLFWLHDFTHMLFPYAWDVYDVSEKKFLDDFIYQERIASTETEVFAYYRIPGLREMVFEDEELYYDVMRKRGEYALARPGKPLSAHGKPDASQFLAHRNKLVMYDDYGQVELEYHPDILKFFQQWRRLTPKWVGERYKSMVGIRIADVRGSNGFYVSTYEREISEYVSSATQEQYERVTMANIRRAYEILGWSDPPTRWRHVPEALHSLEGAVFFQ